MSEIGEEFWFDVLTRHKKLGDQEKVIGLCKKNLPFPAAFREMAIALRKQIKKLRKNNLSFEEKLKTLYKFAVYERFLYPTPATKIPGSKHTTPTYNIAELAHRNKAYINLNYNYQVFGYGYLQLLNLTDTKLIKTVWGEPKSQKDPNEFFKEEWNKYIELFREQEKQRTKEFEGLIGFSLKNEIHDQGEYSGQKNKTLIFSLIGLIAIIYLYNLFFL